MYRIRDRLSLSVAIALSAPVAHAAERQAVRIDAPSLGGAVVQLGEQTGSSIGVSQSALAALPVRRVRGTMPVETALRKLIDGRARLIAIDGRSWRIVPLAPVAQPARPRFQQAVLSTVADEDIVVTAAKRPMLLTRFPAMTTIVGGESVAASPAGSGTDALIDQVPGLTSTHLGPGRNKLFLRGIADSAFTGPTQATVGQYLGDMRLTYNAPDPNLRLLDLARVEVLEGPQGTLYGAGSLGGIIRVVPNAPNLAQWGGGGAMGVSLIESGEAGGDAQAVVNVPIVAERIALRAVGYAVRDGGYIDDRGRNANDVNRTDTVGGRVALRLAPGEHWTIDVTGVLQDTDGRDAQYADRRQEGLARRSGVPQPFSSDYRLANLHIVGDLAPGLQLVSSSGVVGHDVTERYDATGQQGDAPAEFRQSNQITLWSTENRLSWQGDGGFGGVIGGSVLHSDSTLRRTIGPVGAVSPAIGVRNKVTEWAIFGEASVALTEWLALTGGGRFSVTERSGEALDPGPAYDASTAISEAKRTERAFLPSIALLARPNARMQIFARYQEGFRPGGLVVDADSVRRFANDRVKTVEVGARYGVAGRDPIALQLAAAYSDWRDIQADLTDAFGLPTTDNIGNGRIYTLEGRLIAVPMPGLTLDGAIIYNDSRLDRPTERVFTLLAQARDAQMLARRELPNVARFGGRVAVDYHTALGPQTDLRLNATARYVGESQLGIGPVFGQRQGDYVDSSLSARLIRGHIGYSISVANLLNVTGNRFAFGMPFQAAEADFYTPLRPRTVRVGVDFRF